MSWLPSRPNSIGMQTGMLGRVTGSMAEAGFAGGLSCACRCRVRSTAWGGCACPCPPGRTRSTTLTIATPASSASPYDPDGARYTDLEPFALDTDWVRGPWPGIAWRGFRSAGVTSSVVENQRANYPAPLTADAENNLLPHAHPASKKAHPECTGEPAPIVVR